MIRDLILRSEKLIQWIDSKINGLEVSSDLRTRMSGACFDLVQEHQKSVVLLIDHQLTGSAFSLLRILFESYIRGLWLYKVASDADIERYKNEKIDKTFASLIGEVEMIEGYDAGVLSKAKAAGWGAMNGYTHSGFLHLSRRNSSEFIGASYGDEEIIEAINFSNAFGLLSAIGMAELANNVELANEVLERCKEYLGT